MNEINWNDCTDEELLYFVVKLGKELAKNDYVRKQNYKKLGRKNLRKQRGEITIPKNLQLKEPVYSDMKNAVRYPPAKLYLNRFGSWEKTLYLAGFDESFNYYWKKSPDELIDDVVEETTFSKEFVAKMFDGLDKREKPSKTRKKDQELDSNSYEISLPAYHLA